MQSLDDLTGDRCAWCGKPFDPKSVRNIFCCYDCKYAAQLAKDAAHNLAKRQDYTCIQCGRSMASKAYMGREKFCSRECTLLYVKERRKHEVIVAKPVERHCVICGTAIPRTARADKICCSRKCLNKRQWRLEVETRFQCEAIAAE